MTQPLREDCWGRMVEPRDTKFGPWLDARRCQACSRQTIQLICAECAETLAEQEVQQ